MTTFAQRALGAMYGLACGDAYGQPLEFNSDHSVRSQPVDTSPGVFTWTDDTHMSLYLAQAVLDLQGTFSVDAFAEAWGEQLIAWMADPLTASTAPGNTCLAGAANYARDRNWRTSGITRSDGCGAPMRIVALPMAYSGDTLTVAARTSAILTHAHPNAPAATEVLCWLLRDVLEDGVISEARVLRLIERSQAAGHPAVMAEALQTAVDWAQSPEQWLDEDGMPTFDGGWRSVSAVGLAIAACLRWSEVRTIIEKAARIRGDSDSVAAMAGMLVGAAKPAELPQHWVAALPQREQLQKLVRRLCELHAADNTRSAKRSGAAEGT